MSETLPPVTPGKIAADEIRRLVGRDDPLILEIGANDGSSTLQFLEVFPRCRIHAFEPDLRAIDKWRAKIADARATLWTLAIGEDDGERTFWISDGSRTGCEGPWDKSGSLRRPKEHLLRNPDITFEQTMTVGARRLDSWADELGVGEVDFIWADVQGAEAELIAGGLKTLARTRLFYTEYRNWEAYEGQVPLGRILDLLPGFEVETLYKGDVLLRNAAFARSG